jgi:hypothetical protein
MTVDKRYLTLTGAVARQMEVNFLTGASQCACFVSVSACQMSCHDTIMTDAWPFPFPFFLLPSPSFLPSFVRSQVLSQIYFCSDTERRLASVYGESSRNFPL